MSDCLHHHLSVGCIAVWVFVPFFVNVSHKGSRYYGACAAKTSLLPLWVGEVFLCLVSCSLCWERWNSSCPRLLSINVSQSSVDIPVIHWSDDSRLKCDEISAYAWNDVALGFNRSESRGFCFDFIFGLSAASVGSCIAAASTGLPPPKLGSCHLSKYLAAPVGCCPRGLSCQRKVRAWGRLMLLGIWP